jgi:putative oxygen-independent coproporphyrinogen III oxidase
VAGSALSFYIHVPYCVKRCGYCDFNTYTPSELNSDLTGVSIGYIDLLIKEAALAQARISDEISTIFIGGGTPTLLDPQDFKRLLDHLKLTFGFASDVEITIEANPDSVDSTKLKALRDIGINRISFGMQSSVAHVLKVLDRTHNPENVAKAVTEAKAAGFSEINLDLIYGTPGESISDWQKSIDSALALPISHISAYALILEEGTRLANQVKRNEYEIPDDGQTAEKYLMADSAFTAHGFKWYELSNWAKPGSECRHNIAYWKGKNWWGLGPGSHSHINGERFWNIKHPNSYRSALQAGSPIAESEKLSAAEIESERIMLEIRLPSGIEKASLKSAQIEKLTHHLEGGELDNQAWQSGRIALTPNGRLVADRIVRTILF